MANDLFTFKKQRTPIWDTWSPVYDVFVDERPIGEVCRRGDTWSAWQIEEDYMKNGYIGNQFATRKEAAEALWEKGT